MNTIQFCFATIVAFLVVAIGSRIASCENNFVRGWKCCPPDRLYDPEVRFCRRVGTDVKTSVFQRFANRVGHGFRVANNDVLYMTYSKPYCNATEVLVDVPTVEVHELMKAHPSPSKLPPDYCFELTPSDELVAQTCRPRDQYCGRANYTCVEKCCFGEHMNVLNDKGKLTCEKSEIPFKLSAYETDAGGSPVGLSNVLPIYGSLSCPTVHEKTDSFMVTTDGKLHFKTSLGECIIPETEYCIEYYSKDGPPEAAKPTAYVCTNWQPPVRFTIRFFIHSASIGCLVLTLIVYATLPYLQNAHGYYVMFYMACQLLFFVCVMINNTVKHDLDSPLCIPFGYFTLFAILTTCCWLNVICFDIYWTLRYNNSTNRNTSTSVRTIMYHIYCWGFSSICVSTGYFFQHSQNETLRNLAPDIGKYNCFFYKYYSYGTFIFYLLPPCGTLAVNLILFSLTAIHYLRIKSHLNTFRQNDSISERFLVYKARFVMSIKLFLVFGIPFLFWMLCRLRNIESIRTWEIIDIIYFPQGVYIFIIFVAKPKVIKEIRKKLRRSTVQIELTPLNNITGSS